MHIYLHISAHASEVQFGQTLAAFWLPAGKR